VIDKNNYFIIRNLILKGIDFLTHYHLLKNLDFDRHNQLLSLDQSYPEMIYF